MNLETLLHQTFGFPAFRANQEAVCRAATDGRDVLLVMPTGAGKSLCYQLPAIARGGTALVISPLIALMDDQAQKLSALGLRVARIHSGLSREDARQACRDYLDGTLQFLFIAPERMRVPGFPEMLAKKKPALIAIDEAHCISAWGHDFRPDYRTLGEHLPSLRPAPIIALTATATPAVQQDIVAQLHLGDPALFIHGFRRDNLHIEVVEMSKPRRNEFAAKLLAKSENRPAIVYAPSRKSAEELASMLGGKAAAYHAGLDTSVREKVQTYFQNGKLEVVVATIAFGMGIDKADVRTVVHIALPASVEAYYQEIGRAGRDGNPSRTVLLHSFADRKMHDFFLERDYPAATELSRVASALTPDFQMPDVLRQKLRMDAATFDKAAEKLAAQGAATFDIEGNVRAISRPGNNTAWKSGYEAQIAFRRSQIDRMVAYAESAQCRMAALIQHFGDTADGLRPCGHCDFCSPEGATAQPFREPNAQEDRHLRAILSALKGGVSRSTGKLHTDLALTPDRKLFDAYLDSLTRAGLLQLNPDTFTNPEGTVITYKKASLTHEGSTITSTAPLNVLLRDSTAAPAAKSRTTASGKPSKTSLKAEREQTTATYTPAQKSLDASLREWRKAEAAKTGKPAFIVFGDTVLHNVVLAAPQSISELLTVSGIGPEKADRYGADVIALCRGTAPSHVSKSEKKSSSKSKPALFTAKAERPTPPSHSVPAITPKTETYTRPRTTQTEPAESLTPTQQTLNQHLHDWRKAESEKLGLPQFFVLSSSTLRSIVVEHPRTLNELKSINGIGLEKLEKFGPAILAVCNASNE
ncbi:RecQ family ATP-dependent DNA helicase [Granulicella arctica]|uniref:ATP-dependent DNA helicase RecQ n=1 Tax=Granulicella arctica TaxID=940613 RepID=A0A7Y9PJF0_9BACT|nr:RecQ family ATP-dependent DNA helicase [Granulicella arctica]NYF80256.1 ATP-dependent DNA helicase RecQ [Granulicella arctica]